jgi:hypothetical protein
MLALPTPLCRNRRAATIARRRRLCGTQIALFLSVPHSKENAVLATLRVRNAAKPAPGPNFLVPETKSAYPIEDVVRDLLADRSIKDELHDWLNGGHHELMATSAGFPTVAMCPLRGSET